MASSAVPVELSRYPHDPVAGRAPSGYSHQTKKPTVSLNDGSMTSVPHRSISLEQSVESQSHTWTNKSTDWPATTQLPPRRESKSGSGPRKKPITKAMLQEDFGDKTLSLTGQYSRSPIVAQHRRSKSTFFTAASRSFDDNKDPFNTPLILKPPNSVGPQILSQQRNLCVGVMGRGTRDEAARRDCIPGSVEVGPGSYKAPDSVGSQLLSTKKSAESAAFSTAVRAGLDSMYSKRSPGPAYMPRYAALSRSMNVKTVKIGNSTRPPLSTAEDTPGAVYDVEGVFNTPFVPKTVSFTRGKRPENKSSSYSPGCVYDLEGQYDGRQRKAPSFGFGSAKRF